MMGVVQSTPAHTFSRELYGIVNYVIFNMPLKAIFQDSGHEQEITTSPVKEIWKV